MPHPTGNASRGPRILFLDAYDSFTNNIVALITADLDADITIIKIDDARYLNHKEAFWDLLNDFDAVVAGPGPGNPDDAKDIGLIQNLWDLPKQHILPILGICLGFQSLACAHGAHVIRLNEPRHGIISQVHHSDTSVFSNVGDARVVQYQSLHARIDQDSHELEKRRHPAHMWQPSPQCPDLKPLAWIMDDSDNGPTLMGIAHVSKPYWGLQFHPESICTSFSGASIIRNWWTEAQSWMNSKKRAVAVCHRNSEARPSKRRRCFQDFTSEGHVTSPAAPEQHIAPATSSFARRVQYSKIQTPVVDAADICEALRTDRTRVLMLESGVAHSGRQVNAETGRYSIFGVVEGATTEQLLYFVHGKRFIHLKDNNEHVIEGVSNIWDRIKGFMIANKATDGHPEIPFWGGLVGFSSYEACLETIDVEPDATSPHRPDISFTFVERSVVYDHISGEMYIQTIAPDDSAWITSTISTLQNLTSSCSPKPPNFDNKLTSQRSPLCLKPTRIYEPRQEAYTSKIRSCQASIRAGDSYELCLTDQTSFLLPLSSTACPTPDSWALYRRLRTLNPAPFSAYLHFPPTPCSSCLSILSSSPERFLSWTRHGALQFRPIKGTVSKSVAPCLAAATALLSTSKERAENLMIVDLIRHDLHGVVGAGNVKVEKLMQVEEYESVFQLVSVVEGRLPPGGAVGGIDVLKASLPPGSMTGAPKKRSCEILKEVEGHRSRGIYSGVLGYLDVGGGGDFAVVIRTAWSWGDDKEGEVWRVGAGGAVTSQSTEQGEWEEMLTKREKLMGLFEGEE